MPFVRMDQPEAKMDQPTVYERTTIDDVEIRLWDAGEADGLGLALALDDGDTVIRCTLMADDLEWLLRRLRVSFNRPFKAAAATARASLEERS